MQLARSQGQRSSARPIEPQWLVHQQNEALECLQRGEVVDIRASLRLPVDRVAQYALDQGWLPQALRSFPDLRKRSEVPIEVLLLPQILQRLHDEHSLLLAPYMLNNAELIEKLGYNARVLQEGFNSRNQHPRKTAFHGETLKHVLMGTRADGIVRWFNRDVLTFVRRQAPGRTRQYILDGTQIHVPAHLWKKYQNAGVVEDQHGEFHYGYKAVWLQEIIDRKGVIVALSIVPIQVHDLEAARPLVANFEFEPGSSLIMDRGFIDATWITHLKQERGVDVFVPLRRNMECTVSCVELADERGLWKAHPTRSGQQIAEFGEKPGDLLWRDCPVLTHGVLSRWTKKDGTLTEVLFVTTKEKQSGKMILATYDQRAEIEESHKQLKTYQGLERLPSKKFVQVVFRIVMGVVAYNLLNLFLNSEECANWEAFSLKTLRQKRIEEKNPKVIVYTETRFAILRLYQFLPLLLRLEGKAREKLIHLFEALDLNPAPS